MNSSETQSAQAEKKSPAKAAPALPGARRKKKAAGRKKRVLKLKTDKAFAKTYFEAKSKRSVDKKSAFRKKKSKKK